MINRSIECRRHVELEATLRLALEALEGWGKGFPDNWGDLDTEAVTALRGALAQPAVSETHKQEPYCYTIEQKNGLSQGAMCRTFDECEQHPLYDKDIDHIIPLYTTPPQRTWVNATTWRGLTDGDVNELVDHTECEDYYGLVEATEAKLKEKNTSNGGCV